MNKGLRYRYRQRDARCANIIIFNCQIGIYLAFLIGSWLTNCSFYFSTNLDSGQSILVKRFYTFSAQLNKWLRYRDRQRDICCTDIGIFGAWLTCFSFYIPENINGGKSILVEGLYKFSAKLTNKWQRRNTDIVIFRFSVS